MSISDRIITIKKHFGWNNPELGKAAGVTKAAVGGWINDNKPPGRDALIRLRNRNGISDIWILTGKGEMLDTKNNSPSLISAYSEVDNLTQSEVAELEGFLEYLMWKRENSRP